jgi:hypothetical protein
MVYLRFYGYLCWMLTSGMFGWVQLWFLFD